MRIVVVGDALLDVDIQGSSSRLMPDAPVPVVDVEGRDVRAGGAGLAARLLADDGHEVTLVSRMGMDRAADDLRAALKGVRLISDTGPASTPVKTRVRAEGHAIARLDVGNGREAPPFTCTPEMTSAVATADAVLVSDYGRGVANCHELRQVIEQATRTVPVVWDPHPKGPAPVAGVAVAVPNASEAAGASGRSTASLGEAIESARRLRRLWRAKAVAVTRGAQGAVLCDADGRGTALAVPGTPLAVADPCGAGDRLASALVAQLAVGATAADGLTTAVTVARDFLAAGGVNARHPAPAAIVEDCATVVQRVRAAGGTVVATGGCFDILHAGHARTLEAARSLGDCLIVCMNSDDSVKRLKGPSRPLMAQHDRAALLHALACVDGVWIFDDDSPESSLEYLRPDVWVKGGDYVGQELPEARTMARWGGTVAAVPFVAGLSTTHYADALARGD
ncbi:PfkB family carbohydrate kinase [Demequina sp. SO4-13]|uniref:PfkB family carbohydrate kinase n=1 Tax=Demequina sp. SO4-13 TaxID=3401027 RepID=UPI003AF734EC